MPEEALVTQESVKLAAAAGAAAEKVPGTLVKYITLVHAHDNPDIVPECVYESGSALTVVGGVDTVPGEVAGIPPEALALDVVGVEAVPNVLVGVSTVALMLEFVGIDPVIIHVLGTVGVMNWTV